jgi:hypothetical protein
MGMGYAANYADVVKTEFIEKIVGKKLLHAFDEAFLEEGAVILDLCEGTYPKTDKAYQAVCDAFKKKTGLGLELHEHNSADEGDRYDDVDGPFWQVDFVWQKTKAGKKYDKEITRCHYVTFG